MPKLVEKKESKKTVIDPKSDPMYEHKEALKSVRSAAENFQAKLDEITKIYIDSGKPAARFNKQSRLITRALSRSLTL